MENMIDWPNVMNSDQWIHLKELESRSITFEEGSDILIWGYATKGLFTVKEAYMIKARWGQGNQHQNWRKIWGGKWWSKVAYG